MHYEYLQLDTMMKKLFYDGGYGALDNKSRFAWTYSVDYVKFGAGD
jgi:hypothetical protein